MQKNKGFTLPELLTTVAITGVVASLLLPVVTKVKQRARDVQCLTQQRNLYIGLEDAFNDSIPDFTMRENTPEQSYELTRIFVQHYLHPLIKDSEFGELGVYTSQPLTCPYSTGKGRGKARAPFRSVSMKEFPSAWITPQFKGVEYFTYNYGFDVEHLRLDREDANQQFAVYDLPNYGLKEETTVGDWFSEVADERKTKKYASQSISFDSSLLHPHKGRGMYVTLGTGAQRWVSERELNVTNVTPQLEESEK